MKDSADHATIDIFPEKRRGRRVTGTAKSAKERMRAYRQRKKAEQPSAAPVSNAQLDTLYKQIDRLTKDLDDAHQQLKSTYLNPEQMTDDERQLCSKIIADFRRPKNQSGHGLYQSIVKECNRKGVSDATLVDIDTLYYLCGSNL